MGEPVILAAVRTPFGKRNGAYQDVPPVDLLAHVLRAVVARAGLPPDRVEDVITGCVTQAGEQGANIARQAVLAAGFPVTVPGVTLNRMCGSSQQAVHFAAQAVAAGDARYVIAAGVESMTRAPMFGDIGGVDEKPGSAELARHRLTHQGESAELMAERFGITREEADDYAAESHRRAAEAAGAGRHAELAPPPAGSGGAPLLVRDEGIREAVDRGRMGRLPLAFRPAGRGIVTAGNASLVADGAAAVLVGDAAAAATDGLAPLALLRARVVVGDDPVLQLAGVMPATRLALARAGIAPGDLDWIELNEAFATVPLAWLREFPWGRPRLNPWGGAIAHGHPLGATGAGLAAKLLAGLRAVDGRFALHLMCIGHGMATATVYERG